MTSSKTAASLHAPESDLANRVLVMTNELQNLPTVLVAAALVLNSVVVFLAWQGSHDLATASLIAGGGLAASGVNWALLRALPRTKRSYGPDKPSALGAAALLMVILAVLGGLGAPWWLGLLMIGGLLFTAFYATWVEPFRLGVTHQRYTTLQWNAAQPLKLLHLGDLHVEHITARERQMNQWIKTLQPDIILFSGDFINLSYAHDPDAERDLRSVISEWSAPLGVYCIPGTPEVEPLERVEAFVKDLSNLKLLKNSWLSLSTPGGMLHILGMVTTHHLPTDRATLKRMQLIAPTGGLKILLNHSPEVAPEAAAAGFDLYLCGHTHGGQIRLPLIGALMTGSQLGRRFVMGRYAVQQMALYVTRGVGMEGLGAPRARLLCPPEMVLWEIGK